jgi:hypothetical protein
MARLSSSSSMAKRFFYQGTCDNDLLVCLSPRVLIQQYL